jgi:F420H(2)-dependent quinone reductase
MVRAVLNSPLHSLLSRNLALITVVGRRSGDHYTIPVGYRRDGDRVGVEVGWPQRKVWWRNLVGRGDVRMRIGGWDYAGRAETRGDERSGVTVDVQLDPVEPA